MLLAAEALKDVPSAPATVTTPIGPADGRVVSGDVVVVPVLRAGLGMLDAVLELHPSARVGHIGLYRDPATLEPVEYYFKVPPDIADRMVIVCDPMLATGNSAVAAINRLKECGVTTVKLVCLLAAPEGVRTMLESHPDVTVTVAALDEKLNDHGYIVPGLGDAGDRIFGTR